MAFVGKQVFQVFETLEEAERKQFLDHIAMFTTNRTLQTLARVMVEEVLPGWEDRDHEWREQLGPWLWEKLPKKGAFKRGTLSSDFNRLKECLEQFLAFLYLKSDPLASRMATLRSYVERSGYALIPGQIHSIRKRLPPPSIHRELLQIDLNNIESDYMIIGMKRKRDQKFKDYLASMQRVRQAIENLHEFGERMMEAMVANANRVIGEQALPKPEAEEIYATMAIYYSSFAVVIRNWTDLRKEGQELGPAQLQELISIRKQLQQETVSFPLADQEQIYRLLMSLLGNLINKGVEGAQAEYFQNQRLAYKLGLLFEEGKMDGKTFKVLVEVALESKEEAFTQQLIEDYGREDRLVLRDINGEQDVRSVQALLDYARARLALYQGNYTEARRLCARAGFEDGLFVFSQRWVEILAIYHDQDFDFCMTRLMAFDKLLRGRIKKGVLSRQASIYILRIKSYRSLLMALTVSPDQRAAKLLKLKADLEAGKNFKGKDDLEAEIAKWLKKK